MIETIVQNGALYLMQHKVPTPRRALFRKLRRSYTPEISLISSPDHLRSTVSP
jgi:hypothetical protein